MSDLHEWCDKGTYRTETRTKMASRIMSRYGVFADQMRRLCEYYGPECSVWNVLNETISFAFGVRFESPKIWNEAKDILIDTFLAVEVTKEDLLATVSPYGDTNAGKYDFRYEGKYYGIPDLSLNQGDIS